MKKTVFISLLIALGTASSWGQRLRYEVIRGSKKMGFMNVNRTVDAHKVHYRIHSEVIFKVLFSFKVDYESSSTYENGHLFREKTVSRLNGSVHKESDMIKQGDRYLLTLNDSEVTHVGSIDYSIAAIYFREPYDGQRVFSPRFGKYLTFEGTGLHRYKMKSPDGTNVYTYLNGLCIEVQVYRDFANFSFKMDDETLRAVKNKLDSPAGNN